VGGIDTLSAVEGSVAAALQRWEQLEPNRDWREAGSDDQSQPLNRGPFRSTIPQRQGETVPPQQDQRVERRLSAIFAADVSGYSRLMSLDEAGTLRALAASRDIMDALIADHGGRIANTAGDSVLAEFPSAVDAVQCAVAVQEKLEEASAGVLNDRRLQFRIGIHVGDVVVRVETSSAKA
jgi:class 3 adenylate cyclase